MSLLNADSPVTTATDYCRRARRIRASFDRDPFLRHQALNDLAKRRDVHTRAGSEVRTRTASMVTSLAPGLTVQPAIVPFAGAARARTTARRVSPQLISAGVEQDFIGHVAARLHPFGFTFSDRAQLLDTAEQMGISRFRANVILAMHEHQAFGGEAKPVAIAPKPARSPLLIVLAIEIAVVSMLVWVCTF